MSKHDIIISEDYIDLIVERTDEINRIINSSNDIYSFHDLGGEYKLLHIHKNRLQSFLSEMENQIKFEYSLPMGILDELPFSETGIEAIHNQPYIKLRGAGVLIGIIDTGIDYLHPAFIYPDNTSKIVRLWDQTIEGMPPSGFHLGHEYTKEDIDMALNSKNPHSIVSHVDEIGHGTYIAGITAGEDNEAGFKGVAPECELIIVKVKPAKENFKEHWVIRRDVQIFESADIILALRYVIETAKNLNKPIAMNNSFGTNMGAHDDSGISGAIMEDINHRRGIAGVCAIGNEGVARHHVSGKLSEDSRSYTVELKVGDNELGFTTEFWIPSPDIMAVSITSPMNNRVDMHPKKSSSTETTKLLFEKTSLTINYQLSNFKNGEEVITMHFRDPTPGIWTIELKSHVYLHGKFHGWLPMTGWIDSDTFFLNSSPEYTATMPSTFSSAIAVGAYNHRDASLYINSGRGPSRSGTIRPDLVAPGVNIKAPWPNSTYKTLSGTSVASAIVAGSAALLLEWGVVRGNDPSMNTYKVKKYLIGGARTEKNMSYPNNTWGYGKLDLYGAFNIMKL